MWYSVYNERDLNILDSKVVSQFKITNIKEQVEERDENDIFYDLYHFSLYTFTMGWIDYEEYIRKSTKADWNSEFNQIGYKQVGVISSCVVENINQWGECPKCKKWNFQVENWVNVHCLECWYEWRLEEFQEVFNSIERCQ